MVLSAKHVSDLEINWMNDGLIEGKLKVKFY
jgi:hypothetical protein